MMVKYEAWYIDVTSPNGDMDREFYGTLATTLRVAIQDNQDGAWIGMEKVDRYGNAIDYPVFGKIYKIIDGSGKIRWIYKGKKTPKSRSATYSVSKNGSLSPKR